MLVQIKAHPINLIQIYAPTSDHSDEEIEDFYADLENLTRNLKKHEINIIMDDFNAKVGKRRVPGVAGDFGLGQRNERGDRLIEYCQEHDLIITNTMFKLHPRRLYTWTAPGDREGQVIRNQIDYILTNRRFRNATYGVKTYPSADAATDHSILVANLKVKLRSQKKQYRPPTLDVAKLRDPQIKDKFNRVALSGQKTTNSKNGKAPGLDGIPIELLEALDGSNLKNFTKILNKIYQQGNIPEEWLKSVFIPIPKKNNPS
ncbi:craniofacial development protein 2-like [Diorhabda carinulata]|uniref:craniofacial development protein 2-like n=1 Tax=Diorhabda carinulata TaxID=1163345 RepID=UPI0025A00053|nr:craniofacial development protein 2-like [Diorhabda carinulata]XP_057657362.1 craniofacial development protein 2-like [Diorhabda carinulata]